MAGAARWWLGLSLLGALGAAAAYAAVEQPADSSPDLSSERGRDQLMALLAQKERALARREQTVVDREAELRAAEEQLGKRLKELEELRGDIRGMLEKLDEDREARIIGLIKMFEAMRAPQAAPILEKADPAVALEVLERMNKGKAGKILAAMDPDKAAYFTNRLGMAALKRRETR
jgi:flagellar motility protein MotE (MotC chaperone)